MLKNYIKTTWRGLQRNGLYSVINIGGLAVGMAVSFMLLLYVYNEFSFDQHYANSNRLYTVYRNQESAGEIKTGNITPLQVAGVLKQEHPEIERAARVSFLDATLFNHNTTAVKIPLISTDPELLNMFGFRFVQGNKANAFSQLAAVVLTQSSAKKLFGNANAIGQTVKMNNSRLLKVTGIIADHPVNSSFKFGAMISWQLAEADLPWLKTSGWGNYSFRTYALVRPGANINQINRQVRTLIAKHDPSNKDSYLFLYPFARAHLYGDFKNGVNVGGSIEYVRLFMFLAFGILLIACINFMNLSTARSEKRAREVGVRKAVGASRFTLVKQFMGESLLMSFVAFSIAVILLMLLLSYFNGLINANLSIPYANITMWLCGIAITVFTGIVAGSYPALFLSSFKPVKVLKGIINTSKHTLRPRQMLVVVQFTFAICLILCSILIYKQISYIKNRPIGYSQNGLIELPVEGSLTNPDKFEAFRREAIEAGAITDGSLTSGTVTSNYSSSWGITWAGQKPGEDRIPIDQWVTTYHLISTYQLKLLQGRDFSSAYPADSNSVILNEAAVKLMGFKEPLGQLVTWQGKPRAVVGIVQNFVWGDVFKPVEPVIIGFDKGWQGGIGLRLNPAKPITASIAALQQVYRRYNPEYPFEYKFIDEQFGNKLRTERLLGTLSSWFTGLAIFISCLGLFGLASFSAEQRKKEISVRKVLGASIANLWFNLSKEFVGLILISFLIGAAISWYYMSQWLNRYTYHTSVSLWVFGATMMISLLVCLGTVSWQAIKAAISNPVKSLRSE